MKTTLIGTILEVLKGLLFGALAAVIGYAKQEEPGKWEFGKLIKTMVIGGITTGLLRGTGMPLSEIAVAISNYLASEGVVLGPVVVEVFLTTMIVIFADQIVKILVRRTDLVTLFDKLKAFLAKYWTK